MNASYPADAFDFYVTSQDTDGPLSPPEGRGWQLIATNAVEDTANGELAGVLVATWARTKNFENSIETR